MINSKIKNCIGLLLAILMVATMSVTTFAATIEQGRYGSMTLIKKTADEGKLIGGAEFTVYRVATITTTTYGGATRPVYNLTGNFAHSGIAMGTLSTASEMESTALELAQYAADNDISGSVKVTNDYGTAVFNNLPVGLYMVVETAAEEEWYTTDNPFLVSVPTSQGDGWVYDLTIESKLYIIYGAAVIEKVNSSGAPLQGVEFRLEMNKNGVWKVEKEKLTTNSEGKIVLNGLQYGSYRLIETKTLPGYRLNTAPHYFDITAAGTVIINYEGKVMDTSGMVEEIRITNYREGETTTNPGGRPTTTTPGDDNKPGVTTTIGGGTTLWDGQTTAPGGTTHPSTNEYGEEYTTEPDGETGTTKYEDDMEKLPQTGLDMQKIYILTAVGMLLVAAGSADLIVNRKKSTGNGGKHE